MARQNDPFWHHIEEMKCVHCEHQFAKDTSISRIKWHLLGDKRHRVAICGQVPKQVQEAAFLAMYGGNKRHKSIASSSNVNDNAISTTPQEQNNEVDNAPGRSLEEYFRSFKAFLMEDGIDNSNTNQIKGDQLPTRKLVGHAFKDNKKFIWSLLMGDEVSSIGIYGMGGVGKTTLVTHLYNQLLERPETPHVYWITASQDTSINRLQASLARRIGLDLSNVDDELHRAAVLKEELMKKQHKWVLILDDLWKAFDLQMLGIPDQADGYKLILTTRSKKICQQMNTQRAIKLQPILEEEAWTLFIEHLGHGIALSPEVERIAVDIVRECAGLPLGIITMARSLRGVDDPDEWRHTLEKLKESNFGDMEEKVFRVLRISYDRLPDFVLQQCLLYCALFPEGHEIEREELIFYLIDEGIIKNMWREAAFDEGHVMLNRLENAGLLQRIDGGRAVKMHDLIRDMAVCICKENPSVMEQRRKGIEMAGSNIDRSWNHVEQTNDGGNSTHKTMRRKRIEMARLKSGWTLLMTNLILEIASAVFDQLGNAFVGMVLAFVALLLATAELIYMARKERISPLPISLSQSTTTFVPGKPAGTIVEYFGLVCAVWQCFYSTVAYAYARQKKENPIKMSLLPFFFLLCVVISKLIKK